MKKLFLIFFGLFLGFFLVEIFLRLTWKGVIWDLDKNTGLSIIRPKSEAVVKKSCFRNVVRANSWGFHSKEFDENKEADEFRIIVVGDSFVEALQVPLEKTFHYLLEKNLNDAKIIPKKISVYAIGRGGNGTYLNYLYFKNYGTNLKPDLVILVFFSNDPIDDSLELSKVYAKQTGNFTVLRRPFPKFDEKGNLIDEPVKVSSLRIFLRKFRVLYVSYQRFAELMVDLRYKKMLKSLIEGGRGGKDQDSFPENIPISYGEIPMEIQIFLMDYPDYWRRAWETEKKLLKIFKEEVEKHGAKFMVVSIPEYWEPPKVLEKWGWEKYFDFDKPRRVLASISEELKIPYFSLLPVFRERYEKERVVPIFLCDAHWNEVGHRWAAEAIFDFLKANLNLWYDNK